MRGGIDRERHTEHLIVGQPTFRDRAATIRAGDTAPRALCSPAPSSAHRGALDRCVRYVVNGHRHRRAPFGGVGLDTGAG